MPNVGGKKFAYTPEGEAAAAEYAQQTGAPFQMRAKAFNNSPMQKNFGKDLAINKKLDSNTSPILKKTGVTSKLNKSNMEGGLTGKVGLGELDGPLKFKFNSPEAKAKRAKLGSNVQSFFKGLKGSMKDLSFQVSSKSSKEKMKSGGYTPYKDRKTAVKTGTHEKGYSGALGATKSAGKTFKVKPKKGNGGGGSKGDGGGIDYTKIKSGNDLVKSRTTWRTDKKNKGVKFPGQSEINKRLKKNPKKWD